MVREIVEVLGRDNAVVVAHADDESLWCGGLLSRFRDRQWTVIACSTPVNDSRRRESFFEACRLLGAHPIICDTPDRGLEYPLGSLEAIDMLLGPYDAVVTHGEHGEYGHPHHRQVHDRVSSMRMPGLSFGWHPGGEGAWRLDLTVEEQEAKDRALRCYAHIYDSLVSAYFVRNRVPRTYETYDVLAVS